MRRWLLARSVRVRVAAVVATLASALALAPAASALTSGQAVSYGNYDTWYICSYELGYLGGCYGANWTGPYVVGPYANQAYQTQWVSYGYAFTGAWGCTQIQVNLDPWGRNVYQRVSSC